MAELAPTKIHLDEVDNKIGLIYNITRRDGRNYDYFQWESPPSVWFQSSFIHHIQGKVIIFF